MNNLVSDILSSAKLLMDKIQTFAQQHEQQSVAKALEIEAQVNLLQIESQANMFIAPQTSSVPVAPVSLPEGQIVTLNVGGTKFTTLATTLLAEPNTFFSTMLSRVKKEEEGKKLSFFIDRDPKYFALILNFMRKGKINVNSMDREELDDLMDEVQFYGIPSLQEILKSMTMATYPSAQNPFVAELFSLDRVSAARNRVVKHGVDGWDCGVLFSTATRWKVTLGANCGFLMVGVASKSKFNPTAKNFEKSGYYLSCRNGTCYSMAGDRDRAYLNSSCDSAGTIIEMHFANNMLRFIINGENKGVAFTNLTLADLQPAFEVVQCGCAFTCERIY